MNTIKKTNYRDDTAAITADICRVSDNYVRKVMRGDRENELIVTVFMTLSEGKKEVIAKAAAVANELKTENQFCNENN